MIKLSKRPNDKGTAVFEFSLEDEEEEAVTPNTFHWALYDTAGDVVNDRDDESEEVDSTITIVLTGDDLDVEGRRDRTLLLVVWGTYNSDNGNNLNFNEEAQFIVEGVTDHD